METWVKEVNDDSTVFFLDLKGKIAACFNPKCSYDIYVSAVNKLDAAGFRNYVNYCKNLTPFGIPVYIEIVD